MLSKLKLGQVRKNEITKEVKEEVLDTKDDINVTNILMDKPQNKRRTIKQGKPLFL